MKCPVHDARQSSVNYFGSLMPLAFIYTLFYLWPARVDQMTFALCWVCGAIKRNRYFTVLYILCVYLGDIETNIFCCLSNIDKYLS